MSKTDLPAQIAVLEQIVCDLLHRLSQQQRRASKDKTMIDEADLPAQIAVLEQTVRDLLARLEPGAASR